MKCKFRTIPILRSGLIEEKRSGETSEVLGKSDRGRKDAAAATTVCPEYSIMQTPLAFPDLPFSIFLFVCFFDLRLTVNLTILIESGNRLSQWHATPKIIYFHLMLLSDSKATSHPDTLPSK